MDQLNNFLVLLFSINGRRLTGFKEGLSCSFTSRTFLFLKTILIVLSRVASFIFQCENIVVSPCDYNFITSAVAV